MLSVEQIVQIAVAVLLIGIMIRLFDHWVSTMPPTGGPSYPPHRGGMGRPRRELRRRWPNIYW